MREGWFGYGKPRKEAEERRREEDREAGEDSSSDSRARKRSSRVGDRLLEEIEMGFECPGERIGFGMRGGGRGG